MMKALNSSSSIIIVKDAAIALPIPIPPVEDPVIKRTLKSIINGTAQIANLRQAIKTASCKLYVNSEKTSIAANIGISQKKRAKIRVPVDPISTHSPRHSQPRTNLKKPMIAAQAAK